MRANRRFSSSDSESHGRTVSASGQPLLPSALVSSMYGLIGESSACSVTMPSFFWRSNTSSRYAS